MGIAGFCRQCQQNVWLGDQWNCVNGHGWDQISGWYDTDTGAAITPPWLQTAVAAATVGAAPAIPAEAAATPMAATAAAEAPPCEDFGRESIQAGATLGSRDAVLIDILSAFSAYPGYRVEWGDGTDVRIDNSIANASWGTGKKRVDYEAMLKAVEDEKTVYFWELLKEQGAGLSFGGFESETYSTFGTKRSGTKKEVIVGPGGVAMDASWDFSATRNIIEPVLHRHGWRMKVVLRKKSAQW